MSTSTNSTEYAAIAANRDILERVVRNQGYGSYASQARDAASWLPINRDITADDVLAAARQAGVRLAVPPRIVTAVVSEVNTARTTPVTLADHGTETVTIGGTEPFNREHAAGVLRDYASMRGANMDEVEVVLIEAGLVDQEPEPEADDDTPSWARSLFDRVEAIAHHVGFRG